MLGGSWGSGGWAAEVHGLLIGDIWIVGRIGLDRYGSDLLGCRLYGSSTSCGRVFPRRFGRSS